MEISKADCKDELVSQQLRISRMREIGLAKHSVLDDTTLAKPCAWLSLPGAQARFTEDPNATTPGNISGNNVLKISDPLSEGGGLAGVWSTDGGVWSRDGSLDKRRPTQLWAEIEWYQKEICERQQQIEAFTKTSETEAWSCL